MVDGGEGCGAVPRKRPKLYTNEGEEVSEDLRPHWSSVARTALEASVSSPFVSGVRERGPQAETRSAEDRQRDRDARIRSMFNHIVLAKSELEVMLDTLGELQKGSLLTIGGVEKSRDRAKAEHQVAVLATERKCEQLASIANMFRDAHSSLASRVRTNKAFYSDLRRLHRKWKIKHSTKNSDTGFCFDLSFNQVDVECERIEICKEEATGQLYVVVGASASGEDTERLATGAVEVDGILRKVQARVMQRTFNQALHRKVSHELVRDPLYNSELGQYLFLCLSDRPLDEPELDMVAQGTPAPAPAPAVAVAVDDDQAAGVLKEAIHVRMRREFLEMFESNRNRFLPLLDRVSGILQHSRQRARVLGHVQSQLPVDKYLQHYLDLGSPACCRLKIQRKTSSQSADKPEEEYLEVILGIGSIRISRESFPDKGLDLQWENNFHCSYSTLKKLIGYLKEE